MNSIGDRIAYFRKSKGMTQEALAGTFGISAQAVSKWETGTTMPDILLLPLIAEVLDTSIDSLFGIKQKDKSGILTKENIHEEMHKQFFIKMQDLWTNLDGSSQENTEENAKEAREYIKEHEDCQTLVLSNPDGNGVYADGDIALAFNKESADIAKLLDNDEAWTVLRRFADGETRAVFKFILNNNEKSAVIYFSVHFVKLHKTLVLSVFCAFCFLNTLSIILFVFDKHFPSTIYVS